jgi:hypothetical protein
MPRLSMRKWTWIFALMLCSGLLGVMADEPPAHMGGVESSGGLSSPYVKNGGNVKFWVRVDNRSAKSLTNLRVVLVAGALPYKIESCWVGDPKVALGVDSALACSALPQPVAASQVITIGGTIGATDQALPEMLSAIVEWDPAAARPSEQVSLGQLSSDGWPAYWLETHTTLISFFGAISLAGLAFLLRWIFESGRRKTEIKRTQEAETWNLLLQESGRLSRDYYLPAHGALRAFVKQARACLEAKGANEPAKPSGFRRLGAFFKKLFGVAEKSEEKTEPNPRLAFFYWALFERRMLRIRTRINGVHFKNRIGEDIVISAYTAYQKLFYVKKDERKRSILDALLGDMPVVNTPTDFFQSLDGAKPFPPQPSYVKAWNMFEEWLKDQHDDSVSAIKFLSVMEPVLNYELNRPYLYWYGSAEPIELDATQQKTMRELIDRKDANQYLRDSGL